MVKAFKRVFKNFKYLALAATVGLFVFLFSVYFPNLDLIKDVLLSARVSLVYKLHFLYELLGGLFTATRPLSAFTIIGVAGLFGINIAMLAYMIKRNRQSPQKLSSGRGVFSSLGGIASGVLGIGCAACGSLILIPLLAFFGATGFLTLLPLKGSEFGLLAMALILFSIYWLAKKINDPLVCPVEV